jgi:hypothetical protein
MQHRVRPEPTAIDPALEPVPIFWVIYDHPADYPEHFVARVFVLDQPQRKIMLTGDLEHFRKMFRERGYTLFPRDPSDDPAIVESWMR